MIHHRVHDAGDDAAIRRLLYEPGGRGSRNRSIATIPSRSMKEHTEISQPRGIVQPPGPKGAPFVGHLIAFRRNPLDFLRAVARDYGDVVRLKFGPEHAYLINHPDYIRDVLATGNQNFTKSRGVERAKVFLGEGLLTSEGEFWRRQRRLAQPAFHRQRIASYGAVMVEQALGCRARWRDGDRLDIGKEMMRLTLAIVGRTLFGADVEGDAEEVGAALKVIHQNFNRMLLPFAEWFDKLPLPANIRLWRAIETLDAVIYRLIVERRQSGKDHGDLLSMLLLARDEEGDGGGMSDRQLRDEALTIFLAGHGTTANALTWTWYLLSQNPAAEAAFRREIDEALGGRAPSVEDLPNLRYTEMIFTEAMRMYPPAWAIGRRAVEAFEIGGYRIPAGATIILSPWVTHHDPRYFPDPFRFAPERWTPEAKAERPKFSYFPFGGGSRICIGESFARMEGVLLLATLAQQWRLRLASDQRVEPQAIITLRPRREIWMMPAVAEAPANKK